MTTPTRVPYIAELEGMMLGNLKRKQEQFDQDTARQEAHYRASLGRAEGIAA